jgi:hypothetical protein
MEGPENKPGASQVFLRNLFFVGLATLIAVHFLMTLAITLPPTPLSVEYSKKIDSWIYPYFVQNWSFFAPDPPTEDDYVIAQYRYKSATGSIVESSWVNLSRTFNEAVQRNRLSPLEIVQLTILNASGDVARSEIFKDGKLDNELLDRLVKANRQPPALHTLERVAMGCYHMMGIPGEPVAVRVGILHHRFPRFTHRDEPDDQLSNNGQLMFPFVPFEAVASL